METLPSQRLLWDKGEALTLDTVSQCIAGRLRQVPRLTVSFLSPWH